MPPSSRTPAPPSRYLGAHPRHARWGLHRATKAVRTRMADSRRTTTSSRRVQGVNRGRTDGTCEAHECAN
eukprot:4158277-Pyramimonas_sp.AAC.1